MCILHEQNTHGKLLKNHLYVSTTGVRVNVSEGQERSSYQNNKNPYRFQAFISNSIICPLVQSSFLHTNRDEVKLEKSVSLLHSTEPLCFQYCKTQCLKISLDFVIVLFVVMEQVQNVFHILTNPPTTTSHTKITNGPISFRFI